MRKRFVVPVAVTAGLFAASGFAQNTAPSPAPAQVIPAAPVPSPSGPVPSVPAYAAPQQQVPGAPVPTQSAPPVVAPAQPTASAPFGAMPGYIPYGVPDEDKKPDHYGSTYIPVDSWVYPALTRLYSLGYVDSQFLSMRPWTRRVVLHMLNESEDAIRSGGDEEAQSIYVAVLQEVQAEETDGIQDRGAIYGTKSLYSRAMGITGVSLRDSYHIGQTIINDYGRPYQPGFNLITGFSTIAEYGRFSLDIRGEYQHSPSAIGYNQTLATQLSAIDGIIFAGPHLHPYTLPVGPVAAQNPFRLVEASLSFHLAGHEISGGKTDSWLGPGQGGALAWSNNAENIYSFRINRVEPLHIPFVSALLGPIRYDFYYGSLKGHDAPNNDWVHSETFSFKPTVNVDLQFQRTIIFGGQGHEPVTLHTFLKGFFDVNDTTTAEKFSRDDPGARYSDFSFAWRLPFVRKYATLYTDSIAHDDVTPPSAPRRAAYRVGLYLSQVPKLPKLDFRVEGVSTDPPVTRSLNGTFNYFETVQLQGYTNKGFIMGDWIGREGKGGQAWLTYHLSGDQYIQVEYLRKKNARDFIGVPQGNVAVTNTYAFGGTTQDDYKLNVVKRFNHDQVELIGFFQYERDKAPIYQTGLFTNTTTAVQLTFFPKLKKRDLGGPSFLK